MFYSDFAEDYEAVFPFSRGVYDFLKSYLSGTGRRILDVGCATGHYCGRFASEGYEAAGIDLDEAMIRSARWRYPRAEFRVLDLNDLARLPGPYDLVYSTGNVMAHVPWETFGVFLTSLGRIQEKGAVWIFQVINWDYILELDEYTFPLKESEERIFSRKYTEITEETLQFNTELKSQKTGEILFLDRVTMYPRRSREYLALHDEAGYKLVDHFADYGKTPYEQTAESADIYVFKRR